MRKFLTRLFTFIGALVVLLIVAGVTFYQMTKRDVPDKTILEINFERGLIEYVPDDPVARILLERAPVVRDVVEALEKAAEDKRVAALIARVGSAEMGLARIQEVRDAVLAFRSKGKPAFAYAETFGEFGPGNGAYYLATAFDEIYLQPSGDVGLTGLIYESPFVRGTLDKLGIIPRLDHREEYKNVMNIFTERQYTEPHEEAVQRVMESQFGQIVKGIAEARGLSEEDVRALVDRGPFLGEQAVEAKLVDGLAYRDEVYARVEERAKEKVGEGAQFLSLSQYLARAGRPHTQGQTIALIYGVGTVHRGKSEYDPMSGGSSMGAETVAAALREAIEDEDVKAILFRVDSPGGSYVASDTIWRETVRAKEAGKPVIVSMGNVAGSGGYFVAMAADKIVAHPATITGSIGVVGGKMLTTGFWDKIGLSWDEVHTSANATLWTGTLDYTPEQWARVQNVLDRIYNDFTSKVAQGRGFSHEKALEVAKGRIWTGEDAQALNLVDELGGFPVALRLAKKAAGIPEDVTIRLKVFPPQKTFLQALAERLLGEDKSSNEEEASTAALTRVLRMLQPLVRLARELGLGPTPGALTMPELEVVQ
jgi:protease-4